MVRIAATLMLAASTKALTRASFNRLTPTALLGSLLGANGDKYAGAVMGTEDIMKPKAHGIVNGVHFGTLRNGARYAVDATKVVKKCTPETRRAPSAS